MTWDAEQRVYRTDDGQGISAAQLREWVDEFIDHAQSEIDDHSQQLLEGAITIAAFFLFLGSLTTSMHIASSLIAYGGEDEMNNLRWGRVDDKISSELAYLEGFKEQVIEAEKVTEALASQIGGLVPDETERITASLIDAIRAEGRADILTTVEDAMQSVGVETMPSVGPLIDSFGDGIESIIWGEISDRGRMYADAVYGTYENSVKAREGDAGAVGVRRVSLDDAVSCDDCPSLATDEYVAMDEITDIGDSACMGNCRCWFEFEFLNGEKV